MSDHSSSSASSDDESDTEMKRVGEFDTTLKSREEGYFENKSISKGFLFSKFINKKRETRMSVKRELVSRYQRTLSSNQGSISTSFL